jgi:hypothetical protein
LSTLGGSLFADQCPRNASLILLTEIRLSDCIFADSTSSVSHSAGEANAGALDLRNVLATLIKCDFKSCHAVHDDTAPFDGQEGGAVRT